MTNPDAATLGLLAVKVGLLTQAQLQEVLDELGSSNPDLGEFLRSLERKGYLTPWQCAKLLKGDTDGFFLGGYRILYKVASGSFGRVFRAEESQTGRVVAIKVLRRRWSEDPQRIELFEREGKVGMSLRHPNIVEILAVGHDVPTGQYFMVMDFVEGGNLREILGIRRKLEPTEALRFIEDAANGLSYAYGRGLTHRDVKLTNILIASQGTAKLVDFGLAKIYAGEQADSKVERTVDYAGLEKATNVKSGDVRSDIFFLGCVLHEILTGRPPLELTRDKVARMQRHRFDNIMPMKADEVNGPPSLFRLVETMMSLNPQHRFQTPAQLLDALRATRRDLESGKTGGGGAVTGPRTVFIVEKNDRAQQAFREKFKELGYRVLLAADPARANDRFRQQPYDALIVDAGSTGEDGMLVFDMVMTEAVRKGVSCAGILILNDEQLTWKERLKPRPLQAVFVRPVTLKRLSTKLQEMVPIADAIKEAE